MVGLIQIQPTYQQIQIHLKQYYHEKSNHYYGRSHRINGL